MDVFMNVLPLWPPAFEVHGKLQRSRQAVGPASKQRHVHNFVWIGHSYRCLVCFREKRASRSLVDSFPCGNLSNSVRTMVAIGGQMGHRLYMAHGQVSGLPIVFCGACAAMVTSRAVNLISHCSRVPTNGWQRTALGMFAKRVHPKTREPLTQPWPYTANIFQVQGQPADPVAPPGQQEVALFGPGNGSGGGEGSGGAHPPGDGDAGSPEVPWGLPAGLEGDGSGEEED